MLEKKRYRGTEVMGKQKNSDHIVCDVLGIPVFLSPDCMLYMHAFMKSSRQLCESGIITLILRSRDLIYKEIH